MNDTHNVPEQGSSSKRHPFSPNGYGSNHCLKCGGKIEDHKQDTPISNTEVARSGLLRRIYVAGFINEAELTVLLRPHNLSKNLPDFTDKELAQLKQQQK